MTYDFYAIKQDQIDLLDFILTETKLQIIDHYSAYDEEVLRYTSATDITAKFDLYNGGSFGSNFALWSPEFKGQPVFEKINLDPKRCKGHTFRYSTMGWGLIRLYLGQIKGNVLSKSHIGHFNEKGAIGHELPNSIMGPASVWNWEKINKASRKLKYHIHNKMAVKKTGTYGILKNAEILEQQGFMLQ